MISVITTNGNFDTPSIDYNEYGINIITGGRRVFIPYSHLIRIEYPAVH